ncbi:MAG: RNA polymerase sigma factor [Acidobacteria bacterium]|nr:RNA polymerase sigma factor [Acidobacteriota bacterium]
MTFGEIYEEHAPAVYRCLLAWSRDSLLAEELTAETFYRAIVSEQEVRSATARGYLVAIARNVWRKYLARRGRVGEMPVEVTAPVALSAEARVDLERTLAAIFELPEELREPLVLYAQGGLSYDEIAAQLEITLAAVKIRIFRARQKLESYR